MGSEEGRVYIDKNHRFIFTEILSEFLGRVGRGTLKTAEYILGTTFIFQVGQQQNYQLEISRLNIKYCFSIFANTKIHTRTSVEYWNTGLN